MKTFVLALTLLVALASQGIAKDSFKADATYGVRTVAERVVALPQDQDKAYITVFGDANDPKFNAICGWFDSNEILAGLRDQVHFNVIPSNSPHYTERLGASVPALPCVRMQDSQFNPVQEFAGRDVPLTADALAHGLNGSASKAECFRHKQVKPTPAPRKPDPKPQPLLPGPPGYGRNGFPWVLLVILSLVGVGGGLAKQWHDTYYSPGPAKRI